MSMKVIIIMKILSTVYSESWRSLKLWEPTCRVSQLLILSTIMTSRPPGSEALFKNAWGLQTWMQDPRLLLMWFNRWLIRCELPRPLPTIANAAATRGTVRRQTKKKTPSAQIWIRCMRGPQQRHAHALFHRSDIPNQATITSRKLTMSSSQRPLSTTWLSFQATLAQARKTKVKMLWRLRKLDLIKLHSRQVNEIIKILWGTKDSNTSLKTVIWNTLLTKASMLIQFTMKISKPLPRTHTLFRNNQACHGL